MDKDPNAESSTTIGRLNITFRNARDARDLVVELSNDSRLAGAEFSEIQDKLKAIQRAVDVVLSHA